MISKKAIELIIQHEIGGREVYTRKYQKPIWAGGDSGLTIGIGYDLGYIKEKDLFSDWAGLNLNFLNAMKRFCGVKGEVVKTMMRGEVLNVVIPYNMAYDVFVKKSLPKYYAMTKKIYPQLDSLNEDTRGALVSMVYNRGAKLDGESRKEMKAIVELVAKQDYDGIAEQIERSKRLWEGKGLDGLVIRRENEADLIRSSMA
jgi:GH24 family phage-related lysozyme (muramidase)